MSTHRPTRRRFIALSGAAALAGLVSKTAAAEDAQRDSFTIAEGTDYETEVFVIDAPESGPTSMLVGGLHGDEESGAIAAENLLGWTPESGRLVVIPRANEPGLAEGTRGGSSGQDENRQFLVGEEPTTEISRAIWEVVEEYQPDTLLDLHSSWGIYGVDEDTYGQAIFYSTENSEGERADEAAAHLNENYVPDSMPDHEFVTQPMQYTDGMLVTKAASELGTRSFLFEVTRRELDLETQAAWTEAGALQLIQSAQPLEEPDEDEEETDDEDDEDDDPPEDGADEPEDDGEDDSEDEGNGVVARIEFEPQDVDPASGACLAFDASSSSAPAGIECYEWDTSDDGEFDTTGERMATRVSLEEPSTVTLRITDRNGCTDTATATFTPE